MLPLLVRSGRGLCFHPSLTGSSRVLSVLPTVLLDEIEADALEGNDDRIEGVLCGAAKQLKVTRAKPDSTLYLSLMYLAKIKPNIFATEGVIEVRLATPPAHSALPPPAGAVAGWCGSISRAQ